MHEAKPATMFSLTEHVLTENGWKRVILGNLNRFKLNRLRLKRLIPIEHDVGLINITRANENQSTAASRTPNFSLREPDTLNRAE